MIRRSVPSPRAANGFTIIELLVVIVIMSMLAVSFTINLRKPQTDAAIDTTVSTLLADIKSQQLLAMVGDGGSDGVAEQYGVYIQSGSYTLFKNASYTAGNADNFVITNPTGVTMTTTFPSTQLVFSAASGDVSGFVNGSNTITITNSVISKTVVLTVNRYGAITQT